MSKKIIDQIDELQVYFDHDDITNSSSIESLSSFEYYRIKCIIKNTKEDNIYAVSHRISLQLVLGAVVIINKRKDAKRID